MKKRLPAYLRTAIAGPALVCDESVERWWVGLPIRSTTLARIERALREHPDLRAQLESI